MWVGGGGERIEMQIKMLKWPQQKLRDVVKNLQKKKTIFNYLNKIFCLFKFPFMHTLHSVPNKIKCAK